jgi:hypothetical protein
MSSGRYWMRLSQIARRAAVYCRWGDRFPLPERFEIAWAGVIDYLAGCDSSPDSFEVYKAGMRAIGRASDRELREHGLARSDGGLVAMPRFDIYWLPKTAPAADTLVIERVALWQIWEMLHPLHKMALHALTSLGTQSADRTHSQGRAAGSAAGRRTRYAAAAPGAADA